MSLFDTHVHLGLISKDSVDRLIVVQEAHQEGVTSLLSVTNSLRDFDDVYESLKSSPNVYFSLGISPTEVHRLPTSWKQELDHRLKADRLIAIGETGLDSKVGFKEEQIELFIHHIQLADRENLPLIIHNRGCAWEVLGLLKNSFPTRGAVLHCFSEDWEFAQEALELDLYFSFAGNLTYKNMRALQEVASLLPLERILIESESPFLTPDRYRGKRNHPLYLGATLEFLASLRTEALEKVREVVYENSLRFFGLAK